MEELETILLAWFMQAHTAKASIDGPQLQEKVLHAAVHLGMGGFWTSDDWTDHLIKYITWYTSLCWEKVPL